jgi:hypothetical protein
VKTIIKYLLTGSNIRIIVPAMNWKKLITELNSVMTLQDIADASGLASKGHVHDVREGRQEDVYYSVGVRLVELRKQKAQAIRRKAQVRKP